MISEDESTLKRPSVIYTRLSKVKERDKQAGKADINVADQEKKLRGLAAVRDLAVAEPVYTDNDLTAYKGSGRYKGRPGFDAMLKHLRGGEIGAILVYQIYRLYRSHSDLEKLITVCKEHRISIHTVSGGSIDLDSATGQMIAEMLASVAKAEVATLTERAMDGKARIRTAGRWPGGRVPFGYRAGGDFSRGTGWVAVDPGEADLVRRMCADVLAGKSAWEIAGGLGAMGIPLPGKELPARHVVNRHRTWTADRVYEIVTNPRYAALVSYKGEILGEGDWPAIIDRATFDKVRATVASRRKPRGKRGPKARWLMSGIAVCGKCGSSDTAVVPRSGGPGRKAGRWSRGYSCRECYGVSASVEPVDKMAGDAVKRMLAHPAFATALQPRADVTGLNARREEIGKELEEIARLRFTVRQRAEMSAPLLDELEQVEKKLTEAYKGLGLEDIAGTADPAARWDAPSPRGFTMEQKRAIVRALVTVTIMPMSAVGMGPAKGWKPGDKWFDTSRVRIEPRQPG